MAEIRKDGLDNFIKRLDAFKNDFPDMRREFHNKIAEMAHQELSQAISDSGVGKKEGEGKSSGRVQRWQIKKVGSGGGYAAVRPIGSQEGAETGRDGPGAITNYLEHGHGIRQPSGGKNYRPRIKVHFVRGYGFYKTANQRLETKFIHEANKFAEDIAKRVIQ